MPTHPTKNSGHEFLKYYVDVFFERHPPSEAKPRSETSWKAFLKYFQKESNSDSAPPSCPWPLFQSNAAHPPSEPHLALPPWLVREAGSRCQNDPDGLEARIWDVLSDPFMRRRAIDHIMIENESSMLRGTDAEHHNQWIEKRLFDLKTNRLDKLLGSMDFVQKFNNSIITKCFTAESARLTLLVEMMGTISFFNFGTDSIFESTQAFLKNKYSKTAIIEAFEYTFHNFEKDKNIFEWAVLLVTNISKLFSVRDFMRETTFDLKELSPGNENFNIKDMVMSFLATFDLGTDPEFPWTRFRLAKEPGQEFINRLAASYWLKKTLDMIRASQGKILGRGKGRGISSAVKATADIFQTALAQKSLVSLRLSGHEPEPAHCLGLITECLDHTMTLAVRPGQPEWVGKTVVAAFSITDARARRTYFSCESPVVDMHHGPSGSWRLVLLLPEVMAANRRSSPRVGIGAKSVAYIDVAPCQGQGKLAGERAESPDPCPVPCLPDRAEFFRVVDLSVTGVCFETRSPAGDELTGFLAHDREVVLRMGLIGHDQPPLNLVLKSVVRSVTLAEGGVRYIGLQFLAQGQPKASGAVRWQPLGENGVWAIGDWMFKKIQSELSKSKPHSRKG